jgi:hypothetical protein
MTSILPTRLSAGLAALVVLPFLLLGAGSLAGLLMLEASVPLLVAYAFLAPPVSAFGVLGALALVSVRESAHEARVALALLVASLAGGGLWAAFFALA